MSVVLLAAVVRADSFGSGTNQFDIDFVTIPGSPGDGYGGQSAGSGFITSNITHDYRIGVYEITNNQWDKFSASLGVPVTGQWGYSWPPTTFADQKPINRISWYEAAQFVNWLNTTSGYQPAYKFTGTQGTADYQLDSWTPVEAQNGTNFYRNRQAKYFLPTEDEWVKAAYWDGDNLNTTAVRPDEQLRPGENGWNYETYPGGILPQAWSVGSGQQELNGTYDMMGNLAEWVEGLYDLSDSMKYPHQDRAVRAGSYSSNAEELTSQSRSWLPSSNEWPNVGFRVASARTDFDPHTYRFSGLNNVFEGDVRPMDIMVVEAEAGEAATCTWTGSVNYGAVQLTSDDPSLQVSLATSSLYAVLENRGTIVIDGLSESAGRRQISGRLVNSGTFQAETSADISWDGPDHLATITNTGRFAIAPDAVVLTEFFIQNGGTLNHQGRLDAHRFMYNGGTITGEPIVTRRLTLNSDGAGDFEFYEQGNELTGPIAGDQTVTVSAGSQPGNLNSYSDAELTWLEGFENDGVLRLTSDDEQSRATLEVGEEGDQTLINRGTMLVDGPDGFDSRHEIRGNLLNEGTFTASADVNILANGMIDQAHVTNSGTFTIDPDVRVGIDGMGGGLDLRGRLINDGELSIGDNSGLELQGGSITGTGQVHVGSSGSDVAQFIWAAGGIDNDLDVQRQVRLVGPGEKRLDGRLELAEYESIEWNQAQTIRGAGTLAFTRASFEYHGDQPNAVLFVEPAVESSGGWINAGGPVHLAGGGSHGGTEFQASGPEGHILLSGEHVLDDVAFGYGKFTVADGTLRTVGETMSMVNDSAELILAEGGIIDTPWRGIVDEDDWPDPGLTISDGADLRWNGGTIASGSGVMVDGELVVDEPSTDLRLDGDLVLDSYSEFVGRGSYHIVGDGRLYFEYNSRLRSEPPDGGLTEPATQRISIFVETRRGSIIDVDEAALLLDGGGLHTESELGSGYEGQIHLAGQHTLKQALMSGDEVHLLAGGTLYIDGDPSRGSASAVSEGTLHLESGSTVKSRDFDITVPPQYRWRRWYAPLGMDLAPPLTIVSNGELRWNGGDVHTNGFVLAYGTVSLSGNGTRALDGRLWIEDYGRLRTYGSQTLSGAGELDLVWARSSDVLELEPLAGQSHDTPRTLTLDVAVKTGRRTVIEIGGYETLSLAGGGEHVASTLQARGDDEYGGGWIDYASHHVMTGVRMEGGGHRLPAGGEIELIAWDEVFPSATDGPAGLLLAESGRLHLNGGTISGVGTLMVGEESSNGTLRWEAGTIGPDVTIEVENGGLELVGDQPKVLDATVRIGPDGRLETYGDQTLINRGTILVCGSPDHEHEIRGNLVNEGTFTVDTSLVLDGAFTQTSTGKSVVGGDVNLKGSLLFDLAGDDMLTANRNFTNDGTVRIVASPELAAGTYTPISVSDQWLGSGTYEALGGVWDETLHTFTVAAAQNSDSGVETTVDLANAPRLAITDPASGQQATVNFGSNVGTVNFTATVLDETPVLADLALQLTVGETVLSGWQFDTDLPDGEQVALSFFVGEGLSVEELSIWHYDDLGVWTAYNTEGLSYADGWVTFTVDGFSGYAVTAIPEPASVALLSLAGLAMLQRRRVIAESDRKAH